MGETPGTKRDASHLTGPAGNAKKPKVNSSITSFFGAPKTKTVNSVRFDKEKWVASLTPEQEELLKLEIETLHESWLVYLKDVIVTKEFLSLKRFLKKEKESGATIFPPENEVYAWSRHTPLHQVKAVILGQDPYHNHNQAHGLCFSVRPPTKAPPSLVNIFAALKNDYPSFEPPPRNLGLLTPWAERGVLLLNTCLTVRAHDAASHSDKGWEKLTQAAIDAVAKIRTRGVVFLSWGSPAAKRVSKVDKQKHCILQSVHPSPLSAYRGYFNCGHFKKCNDWLTERYGEEGRIDWSLNPSQTIFGPPTEENASPVPPRIEKVEEKDRALPYTEMENKNPSETGKDDMFDIGADDIEALLEAEAHLQDDDVKCPLERGEGEVESGAHIQNGDARSSLEPREEAVKPKACIQIGGAEGLKPGEEAVESGAQIRSNDAKSRLNSEEEEVGSGAHIQNGDAKGPLKPEGEAVESEARRSE